MHGIGFSFGVPIQRVWCDLFELGTSQDTYLFAGAGNEYQQRLLYFFVIAIMLWALGLRVQMNGQGRAVKLDF